MLGSFIKSLKQRFLPSVFKKIEKNLERDLDIWEDTLLSSEIKGRITVHAPATFILQGRLIGDLVAKQGCWVVVNGECMGDIICADTLELKSKANIRGSIVASRLIVHHKAKFQGQVTLTGYA